ncbi:MAG: hypothetical protein ACQKBV_11795, partial [Puniceicoccales bacterium]
VVALSVFASALVHYQQEQSWSSLIDFEAIFKPLERSWRKLIVPGFAWVGLMTIGLPVLPFTFFLGMVIYLGYAIPVLIAPMREDAIRKR